MNFQKMLRISRFDLNYQTQQSENCNHETAIANNAKYNTFVEKWKTLFDSNISAVMTVSFKLLRLKSVPGVS